MEPITWKDILSVLEQDYSKFCSDNPEVRESKPHDAHGVPFEATAMTFESAAIKALKAKAITSLGSSPTVKALTAQEITRYMLNAAFYEAMCFTLVESLHDLAARAHEAGWSY